MMIPIKRVDTIRVMVNTILQLVMEILENAELSPLDNRSYKDDNVEYLDDIRCDIASIENNLRVLTKRLKNDK